VDIGKDVDGGWLRLPPTDVVRVDQNTKTHVHYFASSPCTACSYTWGTRLFSFKREDVGADERSRKVKVDEKWLKRARKQGREELRRARRVKRAKQG
jgi:hypothetical protein